MPNKTIIRLDFKSIRITSFCFVLLCPKDEIQFWWGYGKSVTFIYCWWFCNLIHPFNKQFGSIKKPLKSWFHVTQDCYSYAVSPESCPAWPLHRDSGVTSGTFTTLSFLDQLLKGRASAPVSASLAQRLPRTQSA